MTVDVNLSVFYVLFCLLIIFLVGRKYIFLPLEKILNEREVLIESARELAAGSDSDIDQAMAEYNSKIVDARVAASEVRQKHKDEGTARQRQVMETARDTTSEMHAEAQVKLDEAISQAKNSLEAESESMAASIADAVLGARS